MKVVLVAFLFVALTGCVSEAPAPIPDAVEVAPILMPETSCQGLFYGLLPEKQRADPWLPPGFVAADASTIAREFGAPDALLVETGRTFFATTANRCEGDSPIDWLAFWILVDEPRIAGVEPRGEGSLHWYEVGAYLGNFSGTDALHSRGLNVEPFQSNLVVSANLALNGNSFTARQDGEQFFQMINFGAVNVLNLDNPMSIWQGTDAGTHEFRSHIRAVGDSGFGACTTTVPWIREFVDTCESNQAIIGTVPKWEMSGEFLFHEGQFPR